MRCALRDKITVVAVVALRRGAAGAARPAGCWLPLAGGGAACGQDGRAVQAERRG